MVSTNSKALVQCILVLSVLVSLSNIQLTAQSKRPFSPEDYPGILHITGRGISDDGRFVWHMVSPMQYGDSYIVVYDDKTERTDTLPRASRIIFGSTGNWLAYIRKPVFDEVRQAKFKDPRASEKFHNTLVVIHFGRGGQQKKYVYDGLHALVAPAELEGRFVTALLKTGEASLPGDSVNHKESDETLLLDKPRSGNRRNKADSKSYKLLILDPATGKEITQPKVQQLVASPYGKRYAWISQPDDTIVAHMLWFLNTKEWEVTPGYLSSGQLKQPVFSYDEEQLALLEIPDTSLSEKIVLMWYQNINDAHEFNALYAPEGMIFNQHHPSFFLSRNNRLVTPLSYPAPKPQDDSLLKEERYTLDIWAWDDLYIQSQQLKLLERERKHPFHALALPDRDTVVFIEAKERRHSSLSAHQTNHKVLVWDDTPYAIERTWNGLSRSDVYLMDLNTLEVSALLKEFQGRALLSPNERHILWYNRDDSAWHGMGIGDSVSFCITCGTNVTFYNPEYDRIGPAPSLGLAAWGDGGRSVLLNSRHDIWRFDLERQFGPVCLTSDGITNNAIVYRYWRTDPRKMTVEKQDRMILTTFNIASKDRGLATLRYDKPGKVNYLFTGPYSISRLQQSKAGNRYIYHRESFLEFPELWVTDNHFKKSVQLSELGGQYDLFYGGSVELVRWEGPDGRQFEGKLYLPEHRKPDHLLPMIVYFYERGADHIHRFNHYTPSRSVINKQHYLSHGYAIFEPDIHYGIGMPGEDALTAVLSGTRHILQMGVIDSMRLGIQGQSWGGYQVAYIITKTNLFRAAMAGAAVSNMTSAYGAIRWESGMPRLFQYEQGQSRLGTTLWDQAGFQRYYNNSPLFFADSIRTPLLMMHNDDDGAVPWSQSVELYLAMRRLGRPAWLLVYNSEAHNLRNWPNRVDLSIRMKQFFDHYLIDTPAPDWMVHGRPAIIKGIEDRYHLQH